MRKKDLNLLVTAGAVEGITISREFVTSKIGPDGTPCGAWSPWEMWIRGGESVERAGPWVETANENRRRQWLRLETAYEYARAAGWKSLIEIEDRFRPVGKQAKHEGEKP